MSGEITTRAIDILTTPNPSDSFTQALMRMDKRAACELARTMERADARRALSQLALRLFDADKVHRAMQKTLLKVDEQARAISDTATISGLSIPVVKGLWDVAKHYGPTQVRKRAQLLLRTEQHRDDPGAMEALAAEW
jgi:hypothetical protein